MSEIKVDTLTGKTSATTVTGPDLFKTDELQGKTSAGSITVTSEGGAATMQLQQGLAKAWTNFNGSSNSVLDSINTSSVSDDYTGQYTYNYSNNMSSSSYGFSNTSGGNGGSLGDDSFGSTGIAGGSAGTLSSSIKGRYKHHSGTNYDASNASILVVGDLA